MKVLKSIFIFVFVLIHSVGFAFSKPNNNVLNIGIAQEVSTINPLLANMIASEYIKGAALRALNVLNEKNEWEPQLVKKIPTLENGLAKFIGKGKQKQIVSQWEIKENAVWGDGNPVTGYDVAFSREVATNPNVSAPFRHYYESIEKVEVDAKNPRKFTLFHKEASWSFNRLADFNIIPKHLEEKPFAESKDKPDGYANHSLYSKDPTNPGLYNGPYLVSEFKLGDHITLIKNPKFYGSPAHIEKVVIKLIPNTATLEANLRSGTIDMISDVGLSFDEALALDKKVHAQNLPYHVNFVPSLTYERIELNTDKTPALKDIRVRQALQYAIDRDALTAALFESKQPKAIHFFAPVDPWYTEDTSKITLYPYSVKRAQELLAKAGWKKGTDGYLYKEGKKLSIQIMSTAGNKVRELVQVFIQNELKKVGIEITIKNEPARVFFGETVQKRKFEGMAMFAWTTLPEESLKPFLHSSAIPSQENGFSGSNFSAWKNKQVDQLIEKLEREFSAKKRKNIAAELMHYYTAEAPVIPLYYRANISVTPNNLKGYSLTSHKYVSTYHIENWNLN